MCDLNGESVTRLEALGVRVRLVRGLSEGAIYFQARALAVLDAALSQTERDAILDDISDEVLDREISELVQGRRPSDGRP